MLCYFERGKKKSFMKAVRLASRYLIFLKGHLKVWCKGWRPNPLEIRVHPGKKRDEAAGGSLLRGRSRSPMEVTRN